jgi:hypothetical protein
MATIQRPLKEGSVRTYQEKVGLGFVDILASEMDADLDTIYAAWNSTGGVTDSMIASVGWNKLSGGTVAAGGDLAGSTYPNPVIGVDAITTAKLRNGAVTFAKRAEVVQASVTQVATIPTLTTGVVTVLTFDTVQVNDGGAYATGTPNRFTIPATGMYLIGAGASFNRVSGGTQRLIQIRAAGTIIAGDDGGVGTYATRSVVVATPLSSAQVVQLEAYQDSGAGLALLDTPRPTFWIVRVG